MEQQPLHHAHDNQKKSQLPMIFILGNSHSGSTLLSFLLSFHPDIINLGELKSKTWLKTRSCSCGKSVDVCDFYGGYFSTFNTLKDAGLRNIRMANPLHFILNKKIKPDQVTADNLKVFYESVSRRVSELYPNAAYFVDSSKSIWLLNAWLQTLPSANVRIIWIRRQTRANVASFVKRGSAFWSSLLAILANERIARLFLQRNKPAYLEVNYDHFYEGYEEEARKISDFLGLNLPLQHEGHATHHVISGNARTRQAFTNNFTGLHEDNEWERILTSGQKKILQWIS